MVSTGFPDDEFFHLREQIQRIQKQMNAALPPESFRRVQEQIAAAMPPDNVRRMQEQIAAAMPPDNVRRMQEQIQAAFPPQHMQRIAEQIARSMPKLEFANLSIASYTTGDLRDLTTDAAVLGRDVSPSADELETEVADATNQPLGMWLVSRSFYSQLGYLVYALFVLNEASKVLESTSGEDIPNTLQSVTGLCFGMAMFLLFVIDQQFKRRDDE
jgi:hypothetical protein